MDRFDPIPSDLRKLYFDNVLSPITHHCGTQSLATYEKSIDTLLSQEAKLWEYFENLANLRFVDAKEVIQCLLISMQKMSKDKGLVFNGVTHFPLTYRQAAASRLFLLVEGKRRDFAKVSYDFTAEVFDESGFTGDNNSVFHQMRILMDRIDGATIESLDDFFVFIQMPGILDVLHDVMAGGKTFDKELLGTKTRNSGNYFDKFATENHPFGEIVDGVVIPNPEIIDLARTQRRFVKRMRASDPTMRKMTPLIAGCPARNLSFVQHSQQLDAHELGLTDEQIEILCAGDNPTAQPKRENRDGKPNAFSIRRDVIQEIIDFDCELIVDVFDRLGRAKAFQDSPYFAHNVGLLGIDRSATTPLAHEGCPHVLQRELK